MNDLAICTPRPAASGRRSNSAKKRSGSTKAKFGPEHPHTLRCMSNLANSYADVGRNEAALNSPKNRSGSKKSSWGLDHPDTLRSMVNLANSYDGVSRDEATIKLREKHSNS